MSINAAYATPAEYRRVVGMTDAGLDADISIDLMAVSRYLDGEMRRFFSRDAVAVIRVYAPQYDTKVLTVDDMADAPTLVRVDTSRDGSFAMTLHGTAYELLPHNARRSPEPAPFTQIALVPWGAFATFRAGQRIEVTAQWGWPAVPEAIRRATIHISAILRLETPRATKRITELSDTIETSSQAQNIIRQLINQYKVWLV